jgi:hypothetical protein
MTAKAWESADPHQDGVDVVKTAAMLSLIHHLTLPTKA